MDESAPTEVKNKTEFWKNIIIRDEKSYPIMLGNFAFFFFFFFMSEVLGGNGKFTQENFFPASVFSNKTCVWVEVRKLDDSEWQEGNYSKATVTLIKENGN